MDKEGKEMEKEGIATEKEMPRDNKKLAMSVQR
jgi:hypothetical protein